MSRFTLTVLTLAIAGIVAPLSAQAGCGGGGYKGGGYHGSFHKNYVHKHHYTKVNHKPVVVHKPVVIEKHIVDHCHHPHHCLAYVRPGESLYTICLREYGSGNFWRRVAEFNGMPPGANLAIGQPLKLPSIYDSGRMIPSAAPVPPQPIGIVPAAAPAAPVAIAAPVAARPAAVATPAPLAAPAGFAAPAPAQPATPALPAPLAQGQAQPQPQFGQPQAQQPLNLGGQQFGQPGLPQQPQNLQQPQLPQPQQPQNLPQPQQPQMNLPQPQQPTNQLSAQTVSNNNRPAPQQPSMNVRKAPEQPLPIFTVGSELVLDGQEFGNITGGVRLMVGPMAMPVGIGSWTSGEVKIKLPKLDLTGPTDAELVVFDAGGKMVTKTKIRLIASQGRLAMGN